MLEIWGKKTQSEQQKDSRRKGSQNKAHFPSKESDDPLLGVKNVKILKNHGTPGDP